LNNQKVIVAYSGVHQAFQIALAAHEAGLLDTFYGSIFDAPGKWGGRLSRVLGKESLLNRSCPGLPSDRLVEYPWPEMISRFKRIGGFARPDEWIWAAQRFDKHIASIISKKDCRLFIGVENCAVESFRVGRARGMKLVYDCPGFNPEVSDHAALRAADEWELPRPEPSDAPVIKANKDQELALADRVLVYSEVHQRSWEQRGVDAQKFVRIPLWIEPGLWAPKPATECRPGPLRVLYAGRGTLMKGLPYLRDAIKKCGNQVQLDCVGNIQVELRPLMSGLQNINFFEPVPKAQLRNYYWNHDVLVLPSLGDSFGFVALEAMACGLPVIVTENCGVPVPDPAWRVPIMNSDAIAQRLEHYAANLEALQSDGRIAAEFARQFTPERYREQIKNLLRRLLEKPFGTEVVAKAIFPI
jgi:glycosyltransferase involved in cell wall biosynthesis